MHLSRPPNALAALAGFVRAWLAEVSRDDRSVVATARRPAVVVVGAAAPFATTAYSRARLIRQMHASGLLTDEHLVRSRRLLELADGSHRDRSGASH